MMRRLFTASAGVSLLACVVSAVVATWPTGRQSEWAVARYGRLVIVQREGHGVVRVTTLPWPRSEPWVAVRPESNQIGLTSGVWRHDVWFASQLGGRGYLPWGFADPWNRPTVTAARPMQVPQTFTSVDMGKLAALFGVLPLAWAVARIFRPKRRFPGFDVERIVRPHPIHPQSAQR